MFGVFFSSLNHSHFGLRVIARRRRTKFVLVLTGLYLVDVDNLIDRAALKNDASLTLISHTVVAARHYERELVLPRYRTECCLTSVSKMYLSKIFLKLSTQSVNFDGSSFTDNKSLAPA